jgi:DNA-binding IclR family transcriptional regulator
MKVTPEAFIRAWQGSASVQEVAKKTGLAKNSISATATRLKRRGIPLKSMDRKTDYYKALPRLIALAKALAPKVKR